MSEHKENVPKLRFPGFSGAWEERKLGEVTTKIGSGKTPKGGNTSYVSVGVPLIRSQNIYDNCVHSDNVVYISQETDEDMKNSRVETNDVLLNITGASIGRSAVYKHSDSANVNQHVCIIRPDDSVEADFIQLNLSSSNGQKEIDLNQAGGGREGLNFQQISKMSFFYPKKQEQVVISRFFKQLDHLFNLHQSKLNNVKNLKAGLLQKMFPKNGKDVPEIRFPEFTDVWEVRKLEDLVDFFDEKRIPIDSGKRKIGEYPYYGATGIIDYVDGYIFEGEFVLLAEDGANITMRSSPIAYLTKGKFWLNNHAHIMRMKDGSNKFLLQLLEKQDYEKYNSGTAQPKLNGQVVKKLNLSFPNKDEQIKIGSFFNELDNLISLHQRKLDHLHEQKKALLQQMFV